MDERMRPTTQVRMQIGRDEEITIELKLRPYHEWPPCDGQPRPHEVPPEFAQPVARGMVTVFIDPIASKDFPFPVKCDSPLFWKMAEPWCEGKYVCHHCVEVDSLTEKQP